MYYNPDKVIDIAREERKYLEKETNAYLDDKFKNAGNKNYTKYGRDMRKWTGDETGDTYGVNYAWCDQFVDWCFVSAYGLEAAKKLLGGFSAYTPVSAEQFENMGRLRQKPIRGAVIFFFKKSKESASRPHGIYHTGIVRRYDDKMVYTIEGNTSGASGVVENGGGVFEKVYRLNDAKIYGYGIPNFGKPESIHPKVLIGQIWLNEYYGDLLKRELGGNVAEDGVFDEKTRAAALAVWKDVCNRKFGANLNPSNDAFGTTCKIYASKANVVYGAEGTFVMICKLLLAGHGYYNSEMSTHCGKELCSWIQFYEMTKGLKVDSGDPDKCECGKEVWTSLFND